MAQQTPDPNQTDSQPIPPPPPHPPEMTIMPVGSETPPQPSGRSGCVYGILGALGCLVVLLIPLVVVLLVSGVTINSFLGNITSIFQPRPADVDHARAVYDARRTGHRPPHGLGVADITQPTVNIQAPQGPLVGPFADQCADLLAAVQQ